MVVTCDKCSKVYDDLDHFTYCPHKYFEMRTVLVKDDGTVEIATSIPMLDSIMKRESNAS